MAPLSPEKENHFLRPLAATVPEAETYQLCWTTGTSPSWRVCLYCDISHQFWTKGAQHFPLPLHYLSSASVKCSCSHRWAKATVQASTETRAHPHNEDTSFAKGVTAAKHGKLARSQSKRECCAHYVVALGNDLTMSREASVWAGSGDVALVLRRKKPWPIMGSNASDVLCIGQDATSRSRCRPSGNERLLTRSHHADSNDGQATYHAD